MPVHHTGSEHASAHGGSSAHTVLNALGARMQAVQSALGRRPCARKGSKILAADQAKQESEAAAKKAAELAKLAADLEAEASRARRQAQAASKQASESAQLNVDLQEASDLAKRARRG